MGYTQVVCAPSCLAPDAGAAPDAAAASDAGGLGLGAGLTLELCHAGTKCEDTTMGTTCGASMYLPSFLARCFMTMAPAPTTTGGPGVYCGTATCGAGQQCCIDAAAQTSSLVPYCAPAGTACSCAGPGDAGPAADAGADAAPEASSVEAGADAEPDAAVGADSAAPDASGDAPGDVSSGG
jgi:hypothetical protein